jgi:hypothetical protein
MANRRRPILVTVVGILFFLLALLTLLGGAALLVNDDWELGLVTLIIGLIYLVIAMGCFKGWSWVWIIAVVFGIINILLNIATMVMDNFANWLSPVISILIGLLILWYLFTPKVKKWFRV